MISSCPLREQRMILEYLEERFGFDPQIFSGYAFYAGAKGRVYLGPSALPLAGKAISSGILIARTDPGKVKPTTNLLQLFGHHVKKNFIDLDRAKAASFVNGEDIEMRESAADDGYVLLRYAAMPLGCGLLKNSMVKNMIPKAKRVAVKFL